MKAQRALAAILVALAVTSVAFGQGLPVPVPESAIVVFGLKGPGVVGPKLETFAEATNLPMLAGVFTPERTAEELTGDPEGKGLDLSGRMLLFAMLNPKEFAVESIVGFLPVTDFDAFASTLQAVKGEGDIYETGAGAGPSYIARWKDYAVVADDDAMITAALEAADTGPALAERLTEAESTLLSEGDFVVYVALDRVMETFQEEIDGMLGVLGAMAPAMPGAIGRMVEVEAELLSEAARQVRGLTVTGRLEPDGVMLQGLVTMKPESTAASLLAPGGSSLELMEYLPVENAFYTGGFDGGDPLVAEVMRTLVDAMTDKVLDADEETKAELAEIFEKQIEVSAGQVAFSVGIDSGENGMLAVDEIVEVSDAAAARQLSKDVLLKMKEQVFAELFREFGFAMNITYTEDVGEYAGCTIDSVTVEFESPPAESPPESEGGEEAAATEEAEAAPAPAGIPPGMPGVPQVAEMMKMIYGQAPEARVAYLDNLMLVSFGGDADVRLRRLIDNVKSGTKPMGASAGYKLAAAKFPGPKLGLVVVDVPNYLQLVARMISEMEPASGQMFSALADMAPAPPIVMSASTCKAAIRASLFVPNELIANVAALLVPPMMESAKQTQSMNNVRQLVLALMMYCMDYDGMPPDDVEGLMPYVNNERSVLINPNRPDLEIGYVYVKPAGPIDDIPDRSTVVVFYEKYEAWPAEGIACGFLDGRVEQVADEATFKGLIESAPE